MRCTVGLRDLRSQNFRFSNSALRRLTKQNLISRTPVGSAGTRRSHSGAVNATDMAKQTPDSRSNALNHEEGDPLFNLKHAQAEADLAEKTGGLGPETNVYMTSDEDSEIDEGPRDSQGQRRGEPDAGDAGTTAGRH